MTNATAVAGVIGGPWWRYTHEMTATTDARATRPAPRAGPAAPRTLDPSDPADLATASTTELYAALPGLSDGAVRREVVDRFLRSTSAADRATARRLVRHFGLDQETWLDRFEQVVRETAAELLDEVADGRLDARPEGWRQLLYARGVRVARDRLDRGRDLYAASGMSGHLRRRTVVRRVQDDLAARLGREPGDEEVVAAANARFSHLKDASKASMHFTEADLSSPAVVGLDTVDLPDRAVAMSPEEPELLPHEWRRALQHVVVAAYDLSEAHGRLATWWLEALWDDRPATASEAAAQLDLPASTARRHLAEVRRVARHVLGERYGVRRGLPAPVHHLARELPEEPAAGAELVGGARRGDLASLSA